MKDSKAELPILLSFFVSLIGHLVIVVTTVFYSVLGVILVLPISLLIDWGKGGLMHWVARMWAKTIIFFVPVWGVQVRGQENIEKGKHYVIVSNHQSLLDILAVLASVKTHFKFVAKKELFPIPFMGWFMFLAGYIPLDRKSYQSGKQVMQKCKEWLTKDVSVLLFPEGTRSEDGNIKNFKMGAFKLAADKHAEILPVVVDGTGEAVPKKSWLLKRASKWHVSIGKPVKVEKHHSDGSLGVLSQHVREDMIERLKELRGLDA